MLNPSITESKQAQPAQSTPTIDFADMRRRLDNIEQFYRERLWSLELTSNAIDSDGYPETVMYVTFCPPAWEDVGLAAKEYAASRYPEFTLTARWQPFIEF